MNIFGGIMKQEFFQAIVDGDSEAIMRLLNDDPELINAVDEDGNNALMIAIKSRSANSAKIIIGTAQEKDKNNQDKKGTALKEIMQFPNNQGKTALGLLCIHQLVELPEVLEDIISEEDKKNRNLVKNLFGKWREKRADDVIQMLESDPWLIYITNNRQQNILLAAATLGRVDIVDRILDYLRANPEQIDILTMVDAEGKNVLMKAIQSDKAGKLIDILMGKTTEEQFISLLTSTDRNGNNALILACAHYNEDKEVIGKLHYFLKDKPILFEQVFYARNSSKEDALLTVIRTDKEDTLNFLLEEGIATDEMLTNRLNTEGKNAFSLAVTNGKKKVVSYLVRSDHISVENKVDMLKSALLNYYWADERVQEDIRVREILLETIAILLKNSEHYIETLKELALERPDIFNDEQLCKLVDEYVDVGAPFQWYVTEILLGAISNASEGERSSRIFIIRNNVLSNILYKQSEQVKSNEERTAYVERLKNIKERYPMVGEIGELIDSYIKTLSYSPEKLPVSFGEKTDVLKAALLCYAWGDSGKKEKLETTTIILDELAQSTQNAPYKERAAYVNYVKNLIEEYPYLAEGDAGALIDSNIKKVKNPPYVWALSSITIAGSACLAVEQLVGLETVVTGIAALNAGYLAATAIALVMAAVAIGYGISRAVDNQLVKSFHEEQKSKTEVEELSANEPQF
jgi:ankyrin repeat protein